MIPALIHLALRQRWVVLSMAAMLVGLGVWAFQHQQIDAYPDISGQMVQIITTYPGQATEEVERQVTIPMEIAMRSVPRVDMIRSRTIFGLSIVEVMFEEGDGELLGPAAGAGEARRGQLARRRQAHPRRAGHGLRRDLPLRAGLRRHARPDGAADAARLGGRLRGCCAATAWPTWRISAVTPSSTRPSSTRPSCSVTTSRWAT